jgi:hypothetical protein
MTRNRRCLAIGAAAAIAMITPSDAFVPAAGTMGRALQAYLAFEMGGDITSAIISQDRSEIVGALTSSVGGRAIFGERADVGGLLAGNGLADLGRVIDGYLAAPPDTRPLLERRMAEVGLTYHDVGEGIDIRAPGGALEYDIAVYTEVLDRLRARAEATDGSVVGAGPLEQRLGDLRADLAALRGAAAPPVAQTPVPPAAAPAAAPPPTPRAVTPPPATVSVSDLVTGGRWALDPGAACPAGSAVPTFARPMVRRAGTVSSSAADRKPSVWISS